MRRIKEVHEIEEGGEGRGSGDNELGQGKRQQEDLSGSPSPSSSPSAKDATLAVEGGKAPSYDEESIILGSIENAKLASSSWKTVGLLFDQQSPSHISAHSFGPSSRMKVGAASHRLIGRCKLTGMMMMNLHSLHLLLRRAASWCLGVLATRAILKWWQGSYRTLSWLTTITRPRRQSEADRALQQKHWPEISPSKGRSVLCAES